MNKYKLLKIIENFDEDVKFEDLIKEPFSKNFKSEYKDFYDDVKISIKEDW